MSEEKKDPKSTKVVDLVRKHALHGNSAQAKRLLRNAGGLPKKSKVVKPKPNALKE